MLQCRDGWRRPLVMSYRDRNNQLIRVRRMCFISALFQLRHTHTHTNTWTISLKYKWHTFECRSYIFIMNIKGVSKINSLSWSIGIHIPFTLLAFYFFLSEFVELMHSLYGFMMYDLCITMHYKCIYCVTQVQPLFIGLWCISFTMGIPYIM